MAARKKSTAKKKAASKRNVKKRAAKKKTARKQATTNKRKPGAPAVGSVIERRFKGKVYRLRVTATGYVLGKKTYTSLTSAAKAVTKYPSISGPRFWLGQGSK